MAETPDKPDQFAGLKPIEPERAKELVLIYAAIAEMSTAIEALRQELRNEPHPYTKTMTDLTVEKMKGTVSGLRDWMLRSLESHPEKGDG